MTLRGTAAVLVAAGLLMAACGGSASGPKVASISGGGATPAPTSAATLRQLYVRLAQCVRQHGGNEPDPTVDDQGLPHYQVPLGTLPVTTTQPCLPIYQQAMQIIRQQQQQQDLRQRVPQAVKFAKCMRQHGAPSFPDPDPKTGDFNIANPNDPVLHRAYQACASLYPSR
jgi:hypothetical protein